MHHAAQISPAALSLIVATAEQALATAPRQVSEVERAAVAAAGPDAPWPELIRRTTRLNTLHWLTSTIRHPTRPVPANLSSEQLAAIADTTEHVAFAQILGVFRASQNVACASWIGEMLAHGAPAEVTTEALSVSLASIAAFVDATVLEIDRLTQQAERAGTSQTATRRLALVSAFIDDPKQDATATACGHQLGYGLDGPHHAAILWRADGEADMAPARQAAARLVSQAAGADDEPGDRPRQSLLIEADASIWIWSNRALPTLWPAGAPAALRLAIAPRGHGPAGFRRAHLLARDLRRLMSHAPQGASLRHWGDHAELTLLQTDPPLLRRYCDAMLGPLADAARADLVLLLTYLQNGCNIAECARLLRRHRNTVARHVATFADQSGMPIERQTIGLGLALRLRLDGLG